MGDATPRSTTLKDQAISIRASQAQIDLIDQAARVLGRSRSAFVRETACREAEDVLLDQVFFLLDDTGWEQFQALLDAPPLPSEQLRALLNHPAPWE